MSRTRGSPTLAITIVVSTILAPLCLAQSESEPETAQRYSFALIGTPLGDALYTLIDQTNIELFYESELVSGKTAYCHIRKATEEEVLACILASSGLDYVRQSSGLYVVVPSSRTEPLFGSMIGIVRDLETEEPLTDASVVLLDDHTGAATNTSGRFAFSRLIPGMHRYVVSHVAYEPVLDSIRINSNTPQQINVGLKRRVILSMPIVVQGPSRRLPANDTYRTRISSEKLQAAASSTPDIVESLHSVVGVHVSDALSDVHVQGGDTGEHQYLLDGAPVFVPLRSGAFFGVFSPFALEQITIHKAGFGTRHGSFLSGVIDMTHDVRPDNSSLAAIQIDPLSVNGRIHGALKAPRDIQIQWMTAGRFGLWNYFQPGPIDQSLRAWTKPNAFIYNALLQGSELEAPLLVLGGESPLAFSFSDLHAAAHVQFPGARSLYISTYRGRNKFGLDIRDDGSAIGESSEEAYSWRNFTRQVRYEWIQGRRAFFNISLWQSEYVLNHPLDRDPFSALDQTPIDSSKSSEDFDDIWTNGLRMEFDLSVSPKHLISGGFSTSYTESEFSLSTDPFGDRPSIDHNLLKPARWLSSAFIEEALSFSERTRLTAGSRFTYVYGQQRLYAEPRISLDHKDRGGQIAYHIAAGLYRQFLSQFDVASYNLTTLLPGFRFWIPITRDHRAPSAYHLAASVLFEPVSPWKISVESYYKLQSRITSLDYRDRVEPADEGAGLIDARGYAYGVGLAVEYTRRVLKFRGHYEHAIARRKVSNRFEGRYVMTPWSTPHRLFLAADYAPGKGWTATARWQGRWNRSWGFRQAYYDYLEPDPHLRQSTPFDFSMPEDHTLPAFTQLDLGIAYTHQFSRGAIQARIFFMNLFNEKNTVEWVLEQGENEPVARLESRTSPPFYPSASLRIQY